LTSLAPELIVDEREHLGVRGCRPGPGAQHRPLVRHELQVTAPTCGGAAGRLAQVRRSAMSGMSLMLTARRLVRRGGPSSGLTGHVPKPWTRRLCAAST